MNLLCCSVALWLLAAPLQYTYRIVKTYPHDSNAFTQGLEYRDGDNSPDVAVTTECGVFILITRP